MDCITEEINLTFPEMSDVATEPQNKYNNKGSNEVIFKKMVVTTTNQMELVQMIPPLVLFQQNKEVTTDKGVNEFVN